jgi:hypothetical protein
MENNAFSRCFSLSPLFPFHLLFAYDSADRKNTWFLALYECAGEGVLRSKKIVKKSLTRSLSVIKCNLVYFNER